METNALDPTAASGPKRRGAKPASAGSAARKPRDSLNRSVIIDAGWAIVKRDGLSGLTFQALGDELGAHATSVYRHFRDKDELLLEIIDTAIC
jgi:AcrR family transcriptional regulator